VLGLLAACPAPPVATPTAACSVSDRVVADLEGATRTGKDAFVELFDFAKVGAFEILLRRIDLDGRVTLDDDRRAAFAADDGTPFPPDRERRNVGNFFPLLVQRTVGSGGCVAAPPRSRYGRLLGTFVEPLRADLPHRDAYEGLRAEANVWLAEGGVIGVRCRGGTGGLALVYTAAANPRGYELITIYDDLDED
jgi:hypothetical protein